ncbi:hypothetical protein Tco_0717384 [Tanacetum coccineum]
MRGGGNGGELGGGKFVLRNGWGKRRYYGIGGSLGVVLWAIVEVVLEGGVVERGGWGEGGQLGESAVKSHAGIQVGFSLTFVIYESADPYRLTALLLWPSCEDFLASHPSQYYFYMSTLNCQFLGTPLALLSYFSHALHFCKIIVFIDIPYYLKPEAEVKDCISRTCSRSKLIEYAEESVPVMFVLVEIRAFQKGGKFSNPIGDGDGDVKRFPDGDGDGDGDEAHKRGWGWDGELTSSKREAKDKRKQVTWDSYMQLVVVYMIYVNQMQISDHSMKSKNPSRIWYSGSVHGKDVFERLDSRNPNNVTMENLYQEDHQEHEVNSPQTNTVTNAHHQENIASNSNGTTITRKESRALSANRNSRSNQRKLVFEIDDCAGRIVGDDSQTFITKGGCVEDYDTEDYEDYDEAQDDGM